MIALLVVLQLAVAPPGDERLVTSTGLRIREAPDAEARVVEKVSLGTVLPCLAQSAPVTVGEHTAPFCKAKNGWYFTALTEPLAEKPKQIDALIEARAAPFKDRFVEPAEWPDVYQVHNLMRIRIDERTGDAKLRARIDELVFVAAHPNVFAKDPRVAGDDSQGDRVKNEAFEKLVSDAKAGASGPVLEDAAWALYQHGLGGECEGYAPCVIGRLDRTACRFLRTVGFPENNARAAKAIDDVVETLQSRTEPIADGGDVKREALLELAKVRDCVQRAEAGDVARARRLVDEAIARWKK